MGKLEEGSRKRTRRANIKKLVLASAAVAGGISVSLVAPGVLGAMGKLGLIPSARQLEIIKRSRSRLVVRGLLTYQDNLLHLTPRGEKVLRRLELCDFRLQRPKRWDYKWRVLIFDIPERRKSLRPKIRYTLKAIGFVRLQDSVWVYPYDCEDLITLLKADFKIGKDLLYLIVDSIENDASLKNHFGIKG
jgi:hypothetical protein